MSVTGFNRARRLFLNNQSMKERETSVQKKVVDIIKNMPTTEQVIEEVVTETFSPKEEQSEETTLFNENKKVNSKAPINNRGKGRKPIKK